MIALQHRGTQLITENSSAEEVAGTVTTNNDFMKRLSLQFTTLMFISLVAVIVNTDTVLAQSGGLQLLGIGPNAHSLSLSETITARKSYGASIMTNPANMASATKYHAGASHSFWLETSGNTYFSLVAPTRYGVFGLGVLNSSVNDIEARQTPGAPIGTFDVSYYAFAGSFARKFGPLELGVTGMYLYEQLYELWATGYAITGGATVSLLDERLRIGSTLMNNGQMDYLAESRSPLPTMWKTGVWSQVVQLSTIGTSEIPLLVAVSVDYTVPLNEEGASDGATSITEPWISTGIEFLVSDIISLRGGFRSGETKRRFSTGLGLTQGNFRFDYAYVPFETGFGVTHSLGITFTF